MEREKSKEFDLRAACLRLAPEAVSELSAIMREGGRNSQARLGAIQQILDRAFGRPAAQVEVFHGGGLEIIVSGPKSAPAIAPAQEQAGPAALTPEVVDASARVLAADAGGAPALAREDAIASGAQAGGAQGGGRRAVPVPRGTGTSLSPGGDGPSPENGAGLDGYRSFEGEDE